jgi:predicted HicB family RNase H-like nuclease
MEKAYKTMTLRFSPELHAKLVKMKQESAARSWEEWILKITGIEENE